MKIIQAGLASILVVSLAASLPGLYYYTEAGAQPRQPSKTSTQQLDRLDMKTVKNVSKPPKPDPSRLPQTDFELGGIIGHKEVEAQKTLRVDINNASKDRLTTIPGIGPATAEDIIDFRNKREIQSLNDLNQIRGIGSATIEKISQHILIKGEIPDH